MEKLTMPDGITFYMGIWYSGTPEQFLLHIKQAMHSVKRAGLVDEYYSARKKRITANTNWDKAVTPIIKYKKQNKENGPFWDYEAILKELKKEQDAFLKTQTEATCCPSNSEEPGRRLSSRRSMSVVGQTYVVASTRRNTEKHISTFLSVPCFICRLSLMRTPWNVSRYISVLGDRRGGRLPFQAHL